MLICAVAFAAHSYPDRLRDVKGGHGPDITSIAVSNTKTAVTFHVSFANAPPLRMSTHEGWADMLLIGVDVPPLGPRPSIPGGPWPGANFYLGTHGPSKTGVMVRLGQGENRRVANFKIVTLGSTLTFSVPRRALSNPAWFTFTVAAAREMANEATGGGVDVAPNRGTFRYTLTG
ncbi:MAG: hypothetical protein WAU41_04735 [Gaiellaceae bacterium]